MFVCTGRRHSLCACCTGGAAGARAAKAQPGRFSGVVLAWPPPTFADLVRKGFFLRFVLPRDKLNLGRPPRQLKTALCV